MKKIIELSSEMYPEYILNQIKFRLDNQMVDVNSKMASMVIPLTLPFYPNGDTWLQSQVEELVKDYFCLGQHKMRVEIACFYGKQSTVNVNAQYYYGTNGTSRISVDKLREINIFNLVVCFVLEDA